jgi:hypothetical protein
MGMAYDPEHRRWLIPFKNGDGEVNNIQFYYPDRKKPNKFNLPGLATCLYGLDQLAPDKGRILYLCEGAFDAMALDC